MSGRGLGELDKAREELARAKERLGANEREIDEARQEIEKLASRPARPSGSRARSTS